MNSRTDLALESVCGNDRVYKATRGKAFSITEITIDTDDYIEISGKGKGRYITLEGDINSFSSDCREMSAELSEEIKSFIPEGDILVAGLGNRDITPDALGPVTASKILATRHLQKETDTFLSSLRKVSTFAGGVLGQTGIETAEIIKALCEKIKPSAVIAVDALACSDIKRLGTTVQISDAGISPGSGVSNARKELSENIFGIPVIAIGVPTVVSIHTIVRNITGIDTDKDFPDFMVTPRDVDRLIERTSQLLSFGINLALHPSLDFNDITGLF